jgi:hypothetical protein
MLRGGHDSNDAEDADDFDDFVCDVDLSEGVAFDGLGVSASSSEESHPMETDASSSISASVGSIDETAEVDCKAVLVSTPRGASFAAWDSKLAILKAEMHQAPATLTWGWCWDSKVHRRTCSHCVLLPHPLLNFDNSHYTTVVVCLRAPLIQSFRKCTHNLSIATFVG